MKATFYHHIKHIAPVVPRELIAESEFELLKELTEKLPFNVSSDLGFESRLASENAHCDFFIQLIRDSAGAVMMAGKSRITDLSPTLLAIPFWKQLRGLFQKWTDPESNLYQNIEVFWLEFDREETGYNLIPNIFIRIRGNNSRLNSDNYQKVKELLDEIYLLLFGIPFPDHLAGTLQQCMDVLPATSAIYQLGLMIPRQTEAIRLVITRLNHNGLVTFLKKIGWSGDFTIVDEIYKRYVNRFDYTVINLHIGDKVLPYLGVEMYFRNLVQPSWEPRWKENLELFISHHLGLPQKTLALQFFPGKTRAVIFYPVLYVHGINHLKVVYKADLPLECKAYFGAKIRQPHIET